MDSSLKNLSSVSSKEKPSDIEGSLNEFFSEVEACSNKETDELNTDK
jgi:hypothetical protein